MKDRKWVDDFGHILAAGKFSRSVHAYAVSETLCFVDKDGKRVLCVAVGLIFGAAAFWLSNGDQASQWLVGFFAVLAVTTVLIGAFGWKRPVESVLIAAAEAAFDRILDALW